jgi:hypothetical protein
MATINLGRVKPVFRGAYNASTSYVIDDIVTYQDETYIAITATTGNLPTVTANWTKLAAKGTDGTDVGTTLTTQGDILYRDGSGLQRLAAGTSGQVLQTGGTGANPSWTTVSSDYTKLAGVDLSSNTASSYNFTQFMNDSVYRGYRIMVMFKPNSGGGSFRMRFLNNTTAYSGSTDYKHAGTHVYRRTDNSEHQQSPTADGDGRDYAQIHGWGANASYWTYFDILLLGTQSSYMGWYCNSWGRDNSGGTAGNYIFTDKYGGHLDNTGNVDGVQFYESLGNQLNNTQFTIWGLKK